MISLTRNFALFLLQLYLIPTHTLASTSPQLQEAIAKCHAKLIQDPGFPKAQHMLGMLLEATGQEDKLGQVAELSWQAGNCDDRPLQVPQRVDALTRAGKIFLQLGHVDRAIQSYKMALSLVEDTSMAEAILRIATPLFFRYAIHTSESVANLPQLATNLTQRFQDSPLVHQFHGAAHRKAGDFEQSYQSYHKATTLAQASVESSIQSLILAAASARQAGHELSVQLSYLQNALDQTEGAHDRAEVWDNLGIAYKAAGQMESAIQCFQSALSEKPGDGHALAQLASLGAAPLSVKTFDADYVTGLFDGFSSTFEEKLLSLEYQGHQWVVSELLSRMKVLGKSTTVVDCGCGSGLVGSELAKQCSTIPNLIGVDLSPRMADLARVRTFQGRRIYSQVQRDDAEHFLRGLDAESVAAVLAADVFIYIGELESVLSAIWHALSPSGLLIFSLEVTQEGMKLLPAGRFGHSQMYVQDLAKRTGFEFLEWKDGNLRNQHGAPVPGAVVVLQKKEKSGILNHV